MVRKITAKFFFKSFLEKGYGKMNIPDKLKELRKENGLTKKNWLLNYLYQEV